MHVARGTWHVSRPHGARSRTDLCQAAPSQRQALPNQLTTDDRTQCQAPKHEVPSYQYTTTPQATSPLQSELPTGNPTHYYSPGPGVLIAAGTWHVALGTRARTSQSPVLTSTRPGVTRRSQYGVRTHGSARLAGARAVPALAGEGSGRARSLSENDRGTRIPQPDARARGGGFLRRAVCCRWRGFALARRVPAPRPARAVAGGARRR